MRNRLAYLFFVRERTLAPCRFELSQRRIQLVRVAGSLDERLPA